MNKIIKHAGRLLALWGVLGMCYCTLELLWRGVTYAPMLAVGGLCGLLVGLLNQDCKGMRMWQQALFGTIVTLGIEYISGLILNVWLGLAIWNYSHVPFNFDGQICLPMAVVWFLLMPFAIYLDDFIRWKLFDEAPKPPGNIFANYITLIRGR